MILSLGDGDNKNKCSSHCGEELKVEGWNPLNNIKILKEKENSGTADNMV